MNTTTLVLHFALDKLFTQKDSAVRANLRNQSVDGICEPESLDEEKSGYVASDQLLYAP